MKAELPPAVQEYLGSQDVCRLLNLSLDEVLEYVSLGYLPPMHGGEGTSYRFRLREIRAFATHFLGLNEEDFSAAMGRVPPRAAEEGHASEPAQGIVTMDAEALSRGGAITFTQHAALVEKLSTSKDALFGQYAKYREQVGYRVGQLETLLADEQRRRAEAEAAAKEEEEKNDLLKRKLLEAREALARAETTLLWTQRPRWWKRLGRSQRERAH